MVCCYPEHGVLLHCTKWNVSPQAALQQAKEGLRERDFFISAHGRAEDRLVGTARGLRSQLATAAAELLALFASVDAKTALEGCNASCVRELQGLVASKLQVRALRLEAHWPLFVSH